jgi:hypothetical protein
MRHAVLALVVVMAVGCSQADTQETSQAVASPPAPTTLSATPVPTTPTPQELKKVAVPSLLGSSASEAKAKVRKAGLDLSVETRPSTKTSGTVISQRPKNGKAVEGQTMTIVIAQPLPTIPNVVGKDVHAATRILEGKNFDVRVKKQASSAAKDRVLSQSPSAGTQARPGRTVTLTIAKPLPAPPTPSGGGGGGSGGGGGGGNCTPGYSPCLPPAPDYDCIGGSGDGPKYTGTVHVTGSDPYGLDADGDGIGCET